MADEKKIITLEDVFNNLMARYNAIDEIRSSGRYQYGLNEERADIERLAAVGEKMARIHKELRKQKKSDTPAHKP